MAILCNIQKKIRDLKSKRLWARIVINKYFAAILIFLSVLTFNRRNSLADMIESVSVLRTQRRQELYYRQAIRNTDERIKQLTSNKDTLERFARENYYFQEDGEDVFIIENAQK